MTQWSKCDPVVPVVENQIIMVSASMEVSNWSVSESLSIIDPVARQSCAEFLVLNCLIEARRSVMLALCCHGPVGP